VKGERRRLFVALSLEEETRAALERVAQGLASHGVRGRFVPRENYHVTIAFLGSVQATLVQDLSEALRAAAAIVEPFDLELETVGAFPNDRRPRIIWAGSRRPSPALGELSAATWSALEQFGFLPDREVQPHVTLCRCAPDSPPIVSVDFPAQTLRVTAMTLYESHLLRSGARYVALETLPLCGGATGADGAMAR